MSIISNSPPTPAPISMRLDLGTATPPKDPAATSHNGEVRSGIGHLAGRQISVGEGKTAKSLDSQPQVNFPHPRPGAAATDVRKGIDQLKERLLANGDGQTTARSRNARPLIMRMLSGMSKLFKTVLQAPASLKNAILKDTVTRNFEKSVTQLHGNLSSDPLFECKPMNRWFTEPMATTPAPRGVHDQAVRDWSGEGLTMNGEKYPGNVDGISKAVTKLVDMCGGNEASAEWISRFANQQGLGEMSKTMMPNLPLGPNGEQGYILGKGRPQYEFKSLDKGSVELTISYLWNPANGNLIRNQEPEEPETIGKAIQLSYSLKFDLPEAKDSRDCPQVKISQPFKYEMYPS